MKMDLDKDIEEAGEAYLKMLKLVGYDHVLIFYDDGDGNGRRMLEGDPILMIMGAFLLLQDALEETFKQISDNDGLKEEVIKTTRKSVEKAIKNAQQKADDDKTERPIASIKIPRNSKQADALVEFLKSLIDEDGD